MKTLNIRRNRTKAPFVCVLSRYRESFCTGTENERDERDHGPEFSHTLSAEPPLNTSGELTNLTGAIG